MHGQVEHSKAPRWIATLLHGCTVGVAAWILQRDGGFSLQDILVLACSVLYFLRVVFGLFVLLKRRFGWVEGAIVTPFMASFHIGFAWLSTGQSQSAPLLVVGALLYLLGSYFNTGSELARHIWKKDPAHQGKIYTEGLFRHSMHINYFGDMLLFTGFAMITGSPWSYIWPAVMTAGFVFQQVPTLDAYLAERYGQQFEAYAQRTKKLIPYVY